MPDANGTFRLGSIDTPLKVTMMSVQTPSQSAPERHFSMFRAMTPNYRTPAPQTPDIPRLLAIAERLACCPDHLHQWQLWICEGRFGRDNGLALQALVWELLEWRCSQPRQRRSVQ